MARARNSNQGGYRAGTAGRQYGNRTDLNANRAPVSGIVTPASGGIVPPRPARPPATPAPGGGGAGPGAGADPFANTVDPDTVTPLDAPHAGTEPLTSGLMFGPGPGPDPRQVNQSRQDLLAMRTYLPILVAAARNPETPASVVAFVNYLQAQF